MPSFHWHAACCWLLAHSYVSNAATLLYSFKAPIPTTDFSIMHRDNDNPHMLGVDIMMDLVANTASHRWRMDILKPIVYWGVYFALQPVRSLGIEPE